jgi:hypothetical protein
MYPDVRFRPIADIASIRDCGLHQFAMAEIVNGPFPHNIETRVHRFERMVLKSDALRLIAVSIRDSRQVSRGRPVRPFSRICTVAQAARYFGNNDGTTFT